MGTAVASTAGVDGGGGAPRGVCLIAKFRRVALVETDAGGAVADAASAGPERGS